jgi:hypothetical protein
VNPKGHRLLLVAVVTLGPSRELSRDSSLKFVDIDLMYLKNDTRLAQARHKSAPLYIALSRPAPVALVHRLVVIVTHGIWPSRMYFGCRLIVSWLVLG